MLEDDEWEIIGPLLTNTIQKIKKYREDHECSITDARKAIGKEACQKYYELTGFNETNFDAIFHHRVSLYGPPCKACGKPLRTPQANLCAACGKKV